MIELTKKEYRLKDGTKTVYVLEAEQTKTISEETFQNITKNDTLKFFRRLGGTETVEKSYTSKGYVVTKLTSTNPDKTVKVVRTFEHN